ncbi:MAG TPA: phosphatidylglycerophosphatase A [Candidatus Tectomicrobia bacterium]|nr:phosphatidylglycerophosphatase A [Candidatus Tectomicrobia bacterium]
MASVGGAGHAPVAAGTVGSAVALALLWILPWRPVTLAAALVVVALAGVWAGGRVERALGLKDPGVIVIDEVAGMMLSVLLLPRTLAAFACAFVLFRALDVLKPFPAGRSQALPGGWGVMLDDLIAGLYTLLLLLAARAATGWPA